MSQLVLFLCTGNICRSPLAEGLARWMFPGTGLAFASLGLAAPEGYPASEGSRRFAAGLGVDLAGHRSRPVTPAGLAGGLWVIGMTRSHAAQFRSRWGSGFSGPVGLLGAPGLDLTGLGHSPDIEEVADPYGGSFGDYDRCGTQIQRLLAGWEPVFRNLASQSGDWV